MMREAGPRNGVTGLHLTSAVQGVWGYQAAWQELTHNTNSPSTKRNFESREHEPRYQYLKGWSNEERERFGITRKLPTRDELEDAIRNYKVEGGNSNER